MEKPDKHIPKEEMVDGGTYLGACRNAYVAEWSEKLDKFVHLASNFGHPYMEKIEHWDDVADTGFDGFIPFKKIDFEDVGEYYQLRDQYYKQTYDEEE